MGRHLSFLVLGTMFGLGLTAVPGGAVTDPPEAMACKVLISKPASNLTKFVCKGAFALPSAGNAPTVGGVVVDILDFGVFGAQTLPHGVFGVPSGYCSALGNPVKGYRCKAPKFPGSCTTLLIKTNLVKGVCGANPVSAPPYVGDATVNVWSVSSFAPTLDSKRYCGRFPQPFLKNDSTLLKAKDAPAPGACSPSGAFLDGQGSPL